MFLDSATKFWGDWGFRISVLVSLAAYVFRGLLSGTRRRSASGRLSSFMLWLLRIVLWWLYQLGEISASAAVTNLSLCSADADADDDALEKEKQLLVAFWGPFLLIHLGGPDNLSAYDLEDNMLSLRKVIEMFLELGGVLYALWKYIYSGHAHTHSRLLLAASFIVLVQGITRYVERAITLGLANLEKMQEQHEHSRKKPPPVDPAAPAAAASSSSSSRAAAVKSTISTYKQGRELDDGDALLLAQDLHEVWHRILEDASVHRRSPWQRASEKLLSLPCEKMCKVVEMELSLMYDVLYTKATVVYTRWWWRGYLIRFMWPVCSGAATVLFWLHLHRDRGGKIVAGAPAASSFVIITCLLVGTTFALDLVWLFRALGSTWTYGYLKKKLLAPPPRRPWPWAWAWSWLHHQVLCAGWWRRLHRFVVYLDPLPRLFGIDDPVTYRRWSGTIGRYNLLRECTVPRGPWRRCLSSTLATKLGLQDMNYLSELPPKVKRLVFERVQWILPTAGNVNPDPYTMTVIRTCWGKEALRRVEEKLFPRVKKGNKPKFGREFEEDEKPKFGREFEEDVLVWHIATCIFLSRDRVRNTVSESKSSTAADHVAAIEAMSEYLMFLVAKRQQMLPGLVLHSQLEETRRTLEDIGRRKQMLPGLVILHSQLEETRRTLEDIGRRKATTSATGRHKDDKDKLAWLVRKIRNEEDDRSKLKSEDSRRLVLDAAEVAAALTKGSMWQEQKEVALEAMLELIFNVWVDKLLYAAIRCSRESHAKQLGRGGELTTVLWIVIQHAGPFRIGDEKRPKKRDEKKPTEESEKEEQEEEPQMLYPRPCPYPYPRPCPCPCLCPCPCPCPYHYPYPCPCPYPPQLPRGANVLFEFIEEPEMPGRESEPEPEPDPEPDTLLPQYKPEEAEVSEIPEDEELDPEDAKDAKMPIRYVTLY